jgi:hypothetical protein
MQQLQVGRTREAAFQFRKALGIAPDYSEAALALGYCLHLMGNYEEALGIYDQLLASSPRSFAGWNNRGNTLLELCRFEEAAASYLMALDIRPVAHDTRVALATCFQALAKVEDSMAACDMVLGADPDHAEAHWNRSLLLLLTGNYQEGWREYEWRWKKRNFSSPQRNFIQPQWQGENATGKTILIHAEQGFGDTLQFCRYVPLVAEQGMRVAFEVQPPLAALMVSLDPEVTVVPMGQPLPEFDLHAPLLSLPLIFDTKIDTVPTRIPYLSAHTDAGWRGLLSADQGFKVGLCWAGKAYPDPRRSCPASVLASLAGIRGVSWYSLQFGWNEPFPFPMHDHTDQIKDFSYMAALISQLDLVVTVDTAVAHLAGALGKPVWLMLPYVADWRWLTDRDDSPWYPAMRIFRQKKPDSWPDVLQRVRESLFNLQEQKLFNKN